MKTKLLFIITSLGTGGAERIVSYLCNYFADNSNNEVHLLLLRNEGNTYIKSISPKVIISYLNINGRLRWNVLKIVKGIVSIKPDVCFVGLDGLNILLAPFVKYLKKHLNTKMIVRETNVLSSMWGNNPLKKIPYKIFYNNYDKVICQSVDMATDLTSNWSVDSNKITIINNPLDSKRITELSERPIENLENLSLEYFISVGRLTYQKGYERLINYIGRLTVEGLFPYHLLIIGEGAQRSRLESLINELNLEKVVLLLGRKDNPYNYMRNAKGFILGSYFEGFPNVLLEANGLGIPVLSNCCPGGINEIIIEKKNGIVADFNSYNTFKQCFLEFCQTPFDKNSIKLLNYARYDKSIIIPKYSNLFFQ